MAKTETKTHYTVKNKITGYTYKLPKADVDTLLIEEPHNFEIIDKNYVKPIIEPEIKTVYTQIIDNS